MKRQRDNWVEEVEEDTKNRNKAQRVSNSAKKNKLPADKRGAREGVAGGGCGAAAQHVRRTQ